MSSCPPFFSLYLCPGTYHHQGVLLSEVAFLPLPACIILTPAPPHCRAQLAAQSPTIPKWWRRVPLQPSPCASALPFSSSALSIGVFWSFRLPIGCTFVLRKEAWEPPQPIKYPPTPPHPTPSYLSMRSPFKIPPPQPQPHPCPSLLVLFIPSLHGWRQWDVELEFWCKFVWICHGRGWSACYTEVRDNFVCWNVSQSTDSFYMEFCTTGYLKYWQIIASTQ